MACPLWGVTYAVLVTSNRSSFLHCSAKRQTLSAPPIFDAAASFMGLSNLMEAAQCMICVTFRQTSWYDSSAIPQFGWVTSPSTTWTKFIHPGGSFEKHGEVATVFRNLVWASWPFLPLARKISRSSGNSDSRRKRPSMTSFPTNPVPPVMNVVEIESILGGDGGGEGGMTLC